MKNNKSFDLYIGGATLTFFPINILVLPFLIPLMISKSPRFSDFALKSQYALMIGLYCLILLAFLPPVFSILYLKAVLNAIYVCLT